MYLLDHHFLLSLLLWDSLCGHDTFTAGLPPYSSGLRHCNRLLIVSYHRPGSNPARALSLSLWDAFVDMVRSLRAYPHMRVVYGIATDCSLSLTTVRVRSRLDHLRERACDKVLSIIIIIFCPLIFLEFDSAFVDNNYQLVIVKPQRSRTFDDK